MDYCWNVELPIDGSLVESLPPDVTCMHICSTAVSSCATKCMSPIANLLSMSVKHLLVPK